MTGSNLPPGVTEGMLPGNTPDDLAWEQFHEQIDADTDQRRLNPKQARFLWALAMTLAPVVLDAIMEEADRVTAEERRDVERALASWEEEACTCEQAESTRGAQPCFIHNEWPRNHQTRMDRLRFHVLGHF